VSAARSLCRGGGPFTLIHAYFPDAALVRRAARLGVRVDTQPAWLYKDGDALGEALGEERLARFLGLRAWLDGGVTVAINTDHMFGLDPDGAMNPFNPFLTMDVAIRRTTEGGRVIAPEQGVTRPEALRMMTIDAARLLGEEDRRGSIEPGKLADFVILSGDFLGCPPDRFRTLRAEAAAVGGRVAFER
jgi:predicted amidohydrolase YtcJ